MIVKKVSDLSYKYLRPTHVYESIYDIDFGLLWDQGIRNLFFDVDNTLISYSEQNVSLQCINLFNSIQALGFEHIILVSNNSSVERIEKVAKHLNLPAVNFSCKPFVFTMRRIINDYNISSDQSVIIGDQLLTDILLGNLLDFSSIFVDPINLEHVSFLKSFQYKFQRFIMRSFY